MVRRPSDVERALERKGFHRKEGDQPERRPQLGRQFLQAPLGGTAGTPRAPLPQRMPVMFGLIRQHRSLLMQAPIVASPVRLFAPELSLFRDIPPPPPANELHAEEMTRRGFGTKARSPVLPVIYWTGGRMPPVRLSHRPPLRSGFEPSSSGARTGVRAGKVSGRLAASARLRKVEAQEPGR